MPPPRARTSGSPRRRAAPLWHPDRAQGSLRGRGQAADGVEPRARRRARARLRRVGAARGGGDGPARSSAHARVRGRRDDRPGRQPVGARALARRLERRLRGGSRSAHDAGRDGDGHGGLAAHPVGDVRDLDDQADPRRSSRSAASCRSRRRSTMPGRWLGAWPTASRCSPRSPERVRRRSGGRCGGWPSRRGSASSIPTSPTGSTRALALLPLVEVRPPPVELDVGAEFLDVTCAEMLAWHRRFDGRRDLYRPSIRGFLEHAEARAMAADEYVAIQERRTELTAAWIEWFAEHRRGRDRRADAADRRSCTRHRLRRGRSRTSRRSRSRTTGTGSGFPVVALPSGVGTRSGMPTSVSLIGAPGTDWDLLAAGAALQDELGTWEYPIR